MRINRLFETLYILLGKKAVTAAELSKRFEVSARTVYRDIDALSAAGIPVYTTRGKGGGISLLDGYVLSKSMISEEEQNQILIALQSLAATEQMDASSILSKLGSLFQKTYTNWIEVDFSRWGNKRLDKEKFELLKQAIIGRHVISFTYFGSNGESTDRKVKPLKLVFKSKSWYLQGYCCVRQGYRTFKINRMACVKALPECFSDDISGIPPIEQLDPCDRLPVIKMKFTSSVAYRVYDEFDETSIIKDQDGSFLVSIKLPVDGWLYGFLLSFGTAVEVLEPESIRWSMARMAEAIRKKYQQDQI